MAMQEAYDREKSAALLKEARAITLKLKSEMREIAAQMSRVVDGRVEEVDNFEGLASDPEGRPPLANPVIASEESPAGKHF